jgi:hypothetical protein
MKMRQVGKALPLVERFREVILTSLAQHLGGISAVLWPLLSHSPDLPRLTGTVRISR